MALPARQPLSRRVLLQGTAATGIAAALPSRQRSAFAQSTPDAGATPVGGYTQNNYGGADADYARAGTRRGVVEAWEDGFRTADIIDDPNSFEWWYSDLLGDDSTIVVYTLGTRTDNGFSPLRNAENARPVVHLTITDPAGTSHDYFQPYDWADFSSATDRCDVQIGEFTFAGDLETYTFSGQANDTGLNLTVTRRVPSYRPGSGKMYLNDTDDYLGWVVAVPYGLVEGTLIVDGTERPISGTAYHDHNWGNVPFAQYMRRWWWGRGVTDSLSAVSGTFHLRQEYGNATASSLVIDDIDAGAELVNAFTPDVLTVTESDPKPHPDPKHGGELPSTVEWAYREGGNSATMTYHTGTMILSRDYLPTPTADEQAALDALGVNKVWYTRFDTEIEIAVDVNGEQTTESGEATLETPQFGI